MSGQLDGAVAMVTGAARGIGLAIVEALVARGAIVVPADVDPAVTRIEGGVLVDLRDEAQIDALVAATLDRHGRWDVLVNNAGVARHDAIRALRSDDVELMWAVNVRATVLLTRAAFRTMSGTAGGQVLNVISTAGLRGEPGESVYCATKAAVRGFTEAAVDEGRLLGIRVHGLYPAGVDTPFWTDATEAGPGVDPASAFMTATDVAEAAVAALSMPRHVHVPQLVLRALADGDVERTAAKLAVFHGPRRSDLD